MSVPWCIRCGPSSCMKPEMKIICTEQARASWSAIEPEHYIVCFWFIFGGGKDVMNIDEGALLDGEVAAVHLELVLESIVAFQFGDFVFCRGCEGEGEQKRR